MSNLKLKPCPFCGIEPKLTDDDYYLAHRTACYLAEYEWLVGKRAIQAWNRRAGDDG